MKYIERILPHFCIVLSGLFMTLLIIDKFNSQMNFIDNDITKNLLIVFMPAVVACAVLLATRQRQDN